MVVLEQINDGPVLLHYYSSELFFLKLCNVACVVDSGTMLDISQL
jgi:hypothetical protein